MFNDQMIVFLFFRDFGGECCHVVSGKGIENRPNVEGSYLGRWGSSTFHLDIFGFSLFLGNYHDHNDQCNLALFVFHHISPTNQTFRSCRFSTVSCVARQGALDADRVRDLLRLGLGHHWRSHISSRLAGKPSPGMPRHFEQVSNARFLKNVSERCWCLVCPRRIPKCGFWVLKLKSDLNELRWHRIHSSGFARQAETVAQLSAQQLAKLHPRLSHCRTMLVSSLGNRISTKTRRIGLHRVAWLNGHDTSWYRSKIFEVT